MQRWKKLLLEEFVFLSKTRNLKKEKKKPSIKQKTQTEFIYTLQVCIMLLSHYQPFPIW